MLESLLRLASTLPEVKHQSNCKYLKDGVSNGLSIDRYVGLMTKTYRRFRQDISRADFQALAAIVAVEKAVEENNAFCAEDTRVRGGTFFLGHSAKPGSLGVLNSHCVVVDL